MTLLLAGLSVCLLLWSVAIVIDLRGSRCPLAMYIGSARHLSAPVNATLYLCTPKAGRTAFPSIDSGMFPHLDVFRQQWKPILEEAACVSVPEMARSDRGFAFKGIANPGWRQFYIRWHGTIDPAAVEFCPTTSKLVESAPEIKIAFFSILEPNGYIKPHVGLYRGVLRYQMGLLTPNDARCYISVDGTRHTYYDACDVLFDDTYVHTVQNGCDQPRVILFLDIERPFRGRLSRTFNRLVLWAVSALAPWADTNS